MSFFALSLVLAAACCHAAWNFFVKKINGGPELIWLFSAISVMIYLPLAVYVFINNPNILSWVEWGIIAASAILHLGYFLLLQRGYRSGDLSVVYPTARATGPFLSSTFAVVFLGEHFTMQTLIGAIAVIGGVLMLSGGFKRGATQVATSVLFGLCAGVLIGSYTVWDAYAVSSMMIPPLLLDYASSLGRSLLLAPYASKRKEKVIEHWREHRVGVLCIAVFNPLAYILVLYALQSTPVVYVAPVREVSVLISVFLGTLLLGEGQLRRRLIWAAVIVCGVSLLATA